MIIVKSPFRVSFFGGGTDFPEWFNKFGGQVISSTINYHSYLLINNNLQKKKYNFRYSTNEEVNHINSIKHPCFRNFCKYYKIKNININFHSDLPSFLVYLKFITKCRVVKLLLKNSKKKKLFKIQSCS